ncbi:hypothetical protein RJD39_04880 [Vibrio scophthalmi]|uniref:hypothetical protein n=1 Tax=Vibrio scophthalmi TaxID=45658 RepID=UPI003872E72D
MKNFKKLLKQKSTWRGVALLAGTAASVMGYGNLFSASVSNEGVQLGGAIGNALAIGAPLAIGIYDTIRDEVKGAKKVLENERNAGLPQ